MEFTYYKNLYYHYVVSEYGSSKKIIVYGGLVDYNSTH